MFRKNDGYSLININFNIKNIFWNFDFLSNLGYQMLTTYESSCYPPWRRSHSCIEELSFGLRCLWMVAIKLVSSPNPCSVWTHVKWEWLISEYRENIFLHLLQRIYNFYFNHKKLFKFVENEKNFIWIDLWAFSA